MSIEVLSPMPGTIMSVLVKEGDTVAEDQDVVILEAMKMENPIATPGGGKVTAVKVKVGDKVDTGQLMVVIG